MTNDDDHPGHHLLDLVLHETHRSGMLLNSDELVAVAHLPTAAQGIRRFWKRAPDQPEMRGFVKALLDPISNGWI